MKFLNTILPLILFAVFNLKAQHVSQSVLSKGSWYKIAVLEDGVYKVDREVLNSLGINTATFDARHLAVYGNSYNGMLPQANGAVRPDDLIENAVKQVGLDDGLFDENDYLLFFGKSSDHLSFDSQEEIFHFEKNLYSDTSYYFLSIKDSNAQVIPNGENEISATAYQTDYLRFQTHEVERENFLKTGRYWLGETMSQSTTGASIIFNSDGLIDDGEATVFTRLASTSISASSFTINLNGSVIGTVDMDSVSSVPYRTKADIKQSTFTVNTLASSNELSLDFRFNTEVPARGFVDYAHLLTRNLLNLDFGPVHFFKESSENAISIQNATNAEVWDITDLNTPIAVQLVFSNNAARWVADHESERFFAFRKGQELRPITIGPINNQNLHGMAAADVLYITHSSFRSESQRLASFRTEHSGFSSEVVTVDEILNEYSSGRQDISAIRDFIKHQYDKFGILKYVTLIGDCSYDYKNRIRPNTNFVPIYESRNSVHEIDSYSSDDFYGFLEESEGLWQENALSDHDMEIGIGRIPARTSEEVALYLNKVIRYETSRQGFGKWRNNIAFIADDGDGNIHQNDAENLSSVVTANEEAFNVSKIYLDEFEQINLPNGQESPQAREQFFDALSNGNLIVNYIGHGNIRKLMDENVFEVEQIEGLSNRNLMPFFVTATCEFGNYDNPTWISGGEQILLHNQGGAIALLCSARPVYSNTNFLINQAFYDAAMIRVDDQFQRLGDIMRLTKNNSLVGTRNRNYALLGDASMRLAFPKQKMRLNNLSGVNGIKVDTLKALGKYELQGEVLSNGVTDIDFSGKAVVSVYDKPARFKTKGDESDAQIFSRQDVILFQGEVSVTNGQFSSEFIMPINIDYSFSSGKVSFYALNKEETVDAHGSNSELVIGGSSENFDDDNTPPEVQIFINDTNFQSGNTVSINSHLLVKLKDEHGINVSRLGFGNDLTMQLDELEPVVINNYYTAALDSYQEGWVDYPLNNLTIGKHKLRITAFDIYNNRAESEIDFNVTDKASIDITELYNYPNPMTNQTTFVFSHDRESEELTAWLTISNFHGQIILRNQYRFLDSSSQIDGIIWNGTDAQGRQLDKGIYIYSITLQSEVDRAKTIRHQKLIILN